eukprot:CAMPEP_0184421748 /NCGR_PEP_ID=MMETSP0738-20130409/67706_1 /TAXON_ID=385413 /ORGANISM="Thalassiosira miniscula, Strain CCMP1093" /LENGTH=74 /DNA_ID=CAMNT_0026783191 /DNA_START=247 /DNA_END=471 /DNA_ORIENTATION=+
MSSVITAKIGTVSNKGFKRPLSIYAVMKGLSCPLIKPIFLGVRPPVTNIPPVGMNFKLAFPTSAPYALIMICAA